MESCAVTLQVLSEVKELCSFLEEQGDEYFIAAVTHENNFLHTGSTKGRQFLENNPDLAHRIGCMFMTHCYGKRNLASELSLQKTSDDLSDMNSYGNDFSCTISDNNQTCDNYYEDSTEATEVKEPVSVEIHKHRNDEAPECENALLKDSVVQNTKELAQCQMNQDVLDETKSTDKASTFEETAGNISLVTKVKIESDVFEIEWGGNNEPYGAENSEAEADSILQKSIKDALIAPESIKKEIEDTEYHPSISEQQTIVKSPVSEIVKDRTLRKLLMTDSSKRSLTRSDTPVMAVTNDNEIRSGAIDSEYTTVEVCASSDKKNSSYAILNVPTTITSKPFSSTLKATKRVTKQKQPEQSNYRSLITGNLVKVVNRDEGNTLDVQKRDMLVDCIKGAGTAKKIVSVLDTQRNIGAREKSFEKSSISGDSVQHGLKMMAERLVESWISKQDSETETKQDSVYTDKQNVSLIKVKKEPYWDTEINTNGRFEKAGINSNELRQGKHKYNIGIRTTADPATEFPRTLSKQSDSKVGNHNFQIKVKEEPKWEVCEEEMLTNKFSTNFQIKVKEEPKWEVCEEEMLTNKFSTTNKNLLTNLTTIDKKQPTQDNLQQVASLPVVKGKYDDFFDDLAKSIKTEQELLYRDEIDTVYHTEDFIRQGNEMVCQEKKMARITKKNKISTETQAKEEDEHINEGYKNITFPVLTICNDMDNVDLPGYNQTGSGSQKKAGKHYKKSNPEYHSKRKTKKRESKNPLLKVTSQGKGEGRNSRKEIKSERGFASVKGCDVGDPNIKTHVADVRIKSEVFENADDVREEEEMYLSYSYDSSEHKCCAIGQVDNADDRFCDTTNQEIHNHHDFENSYQPSSCKKRKVLDSNSDMEAMYVASTQDSHLKRMVQITSEKRSAQGNQLIRIPGSDDVDHQEEEEDIFSQFLQSKGNQDIFEDSLSVPSSPSFESDKTREEKLIKKSSNLSDRTSGSSAGAQFRSISNFIENAQKRVDNVKRRRKTTNIKSETQHTYIKNKERLVPDDKRDRAEPPPVPRIVTYTSLLTGKVMAIDSYSVAKPSK